MSFLLVWDGISLEILLYSHSSWDLGPVSQSYTFALKSQGRAVGRAVLSSVVLLLRLLHRRNALPLLN